MRIESWPKSIQMKMGKSAEKFFRNRLERVLFLQVVTEKSCLKKPEILFQITADSGVPNVGSGGDFADFLRTSLFESENVNGGTAYFSLEELNAELTAREDLTVKVVAKDANGNVDKDFRGTIRFSSTDSEAELPSDYTFKASDQGVHTFYLAVSFGTLGRQTLSVHDLGDFRIAGELPVNVIDNSAEEFLEPQIVITVPNDNASFSSSRLTIGGDSVGCGAIQIADGPTILTDNLRPRSNGTFTYQTPNLAEGYHEFVASCLPNGNTDTLGSGAGNTSGNTNGGAGNVNGGAGNGSNSGNAASGSGAGGNAGSAGNNGVIRSDPVGVFVDRTPPNVMSVQVIPENDLIPGESYELRIGGSEDLSKAEAMVNNQLLILEQIDNRTFTTTSEAPLSPGVYPVSASIFDLLGNELNEGNAAAITVIDPMPAAPEEVPEEPAAEAELLPVAPGEVTNLTVRSRDCSSTTLIWSPAQDDNEVTRYQVDCAFSAEKLTENEELVLQFQEPTEEIVNAEALETYATFTNFTPTDGRTQWYIDGLDSGKEYFCQVRGIDNENLKGVPSRPIETTPYCEAAAPQVVPPETGANYRYWPFLVAFLVGGFTLLFFRKQS